VTVRIAIDEWGDPNPRKIQQAVDILHRGGVAAYPTDSIYALGCAPEAKAAIERIYRAKQMHKNQRLALICRICARRRSSACSRRPRSGSRSASSPGRTRSSCRRRAPRRGR